MLTRHMGTRHQMKAARSVLMPSATGGRKRREVGATAMDAEGDNQQQLEMGEQQLSSASAAFLNNPGQQQGEQARQLIRERLGERLANRRDNQNSRESVRREEGREAQEQESIPPDPGSSNSSASLMGAKEMEGKQ